MGVDGVKNAVTCMFVAIAPANGGIVLTCLSPGVM
nr:MAG TPA: hypothetical protein [Caudoviricetes sp.]